MYNGIDISALQGYPLDFNKITASGIKFIINRCGIGNDSIDIHYKYNIAAAKAAGLYVACYHFIYPLPPSVSSPNRDPIKQANLHWNAAGGELAFIDCEFPNEGEFAKWGCTPVQINEWMKAYFQEYTRLDGGRKPGIYTYNYWCKAVKMDPFFTQYDLWIASYESSPVIPSPFTTWKLWQNTGGKSAKLYNGSPVDTNLAQDLSLWPPTTPVVPEPQPDVSLNAEPQEPVITVVNPPAPSTPPPPSSNLVSSIGKIISSFFK